MLVRFESRYQRLMTLKLTAINFLEVTVCDMLGVIVWCEVAADFECPGWSGAKWG